MADKVEKWLQENTERFINNNLDSLDYKSLLRAALDSPECNEALQHKVVDDLNEMFGMSQMLRDGREERNRLEKLIYDSQIAADCIVRQTHELPLAIKEWKQRALDAEAQLAAALRDKERLETLLREVKLAVGSLDYPGYLYVEARVGAENHRGQCCRLIVDRRGLTDKPDEISVYENDTAHEVFKRIFEVTRKFDAAMSSSQPPAQEKESQAK